ncbi:MAG: hypothetical protein FJW99_08280 [Actinobacteria bacterium]|nr:hypothetical protein [Actinomycetota bacterium]
MSPATRISLVAATVLTMPTLALAGGAGERLSVLVDPVAGDDARCGLEVVDNQWDLRLGCRTIARAAVLENAAPPGRGVFVYLRPGRHDVTRLVQFRGAVQMVGPGGVQALVNLTGQGRLVFGGGAGLSDLGITGTAPGTWVSATGPWVQLHGATITRLRADAPTVSLRTDGTYVGSSLVVASGHPTAMVATGTGLIQFSTVSGGRLAVASRVVGSLAAPTVNATVLAGGLASWGGSPGIYNTAITTPQGQNTYAVEVREEPGGVVQNQNRPRIVLSSIWQRSCMPALAVFPARAPGIEAYFLLAGSLLRVPAPGCPGAISHIDLPGGTGGVIHNTYVAPVPGPLGRNLLMGFGCCDVSSTLIHTGDPGVEGGLAGRDWPGGMMPAAGSSLIDRASDQFSAMVADVYPQSLSMPPDGDAAPEARPRAGNNLRNPAPDIGAYERPDQLGAVPPPPPPGPGGIDIQPAPDGGLAPVVNGMEGAIAAPGAPTAGVDTGQRVALPARRAVARVGLLVRKTAPVAGPVRVRVRTFQASRVVVVLRRDFRDAERAKRSRVIGRQVVRFAKAGVRWVSVPLNSGARRGLVGVSATARRPGLDPGFDLDSLRLVGANPVTMSAPSALRAGANRVVVTTRRAGRVVVVARTASGRVIGKQAFVATGAGRRVITLTLAPAGVVTGTIAISARIAGANAVTVTRPAG